MMQLSDVEVIVHGQGRTTNDCFTKLSQKLRLLPLNQGRFNFDFKYCSRTNRDESAAYVLHHGKKIEKMIDGWSTTFVSSTPITINEYFFELEMVNCAASSGIYVGVTSDAKHTNFGGNLEQQTTCAIYNTKRGNMFTESFARMYKSAELKKGDIVGVVVDHFEDAIKFYINGDLIAIGHKKPSDLGAELYVFVNLYYAKQIMAQCKKYSLLDLKDSRDVKQ